MSTQYAFGKIVTDGLVLALDAADKNSYPGSGTTWTDMSGNGNNGTLTNGPTFSSVNQGSIVFDGTNDYVNLTDIPSITTNATFCAWVNAVDFIEDRAIMAVKDVLIQLTGTGILYWYDVDVDPLFFSGTYSTNTWYQVIISQSGTSISVYKNGVFSSTQTGGNIGTSYGNKQIGSYFGTQKFWIGNIANVQIYNRALSASEVSQNYNAQKSRFGL